MIVGLVILYLFAFVGLLIAANRHGKEQKRHNFWDTLIAYFLQFFLIWWALGWRFW